MGGIRSVGRTWVVTERGEQKVRKTPFSQYPLEATHDRISLSGFNNFYTLAVFPNFLINMEMVLVRTTNLS